MAHYPCQDSKNMDYLQIQTCLIISKNKEHSFNKPSVNKYYHQMKCKVIKNQFKYNTKVMKAQSSALRSHTLRTSQVRS